MLVNGKLIGVVLVHEPSKKDTETLQKFLDLRVTSVVPSHKASALLDGKRLGR